jgi:hypothetical protein
VAFLVLVAYLFQGACPFLEACLFLALLSLPEAILLELGLVLFPVPMILLAVLPPEVSLLFRVSLLP